MDKTLMSHGHKNKTVVTPSKYQAVPCTLFRSFGRSILTKNIWNAEGNTPRLVGTRLLLLSRFTSSRKSSISQHDSNKGVNAFATGTARQRRWCSVGYTCLTKKTVKKPGNACHAARTSSFVVKRDADGVGTVVFSTTFLGDGSDTTTGGVFSSLVVLGTQSTRATRAFAMRPGVARSRRGMAPVRDDQAPRNEGIHRCFLVVGFHSTVDDSRSNENRVVGWRQNHDELNLVFVSPFHARVLAVAQHERRVSASPSATAASRLLCHLQT